MIYDWINEWSVSGCDYCLYKEWMQFSLLTLSENQLKGFYGQLTSFHFPIYEIYVGDFVVMDSKADPLTLFFVAMQIIFGKH